MVQWLRIHLAMQGIPVRLLAWEDPTCLGATKPVHHDYLALQSLQAATTADCAPKEEKPLSEKPTHDNEKQPPLPQLEEKAMATHSSTLAWKIPWTAACQAPPSMSPSKSRTRLSDFTFTFHFHALEKEMATHSSVLAWRVPGTGEPGGLPSMGSHRVGHD